MYFFLGLLVVGIGVLNIKMPAEMIKFQHMFTFKKGAEPTDFAISTTRFGGVCGVIFGIVIMILSISMF